MFIPYFGLGILFIVTLLVLIPLGIYWLLRPLGYDDPWVERTLLLGTGFLLILLVLWIAGR